MAVVINEFPQFLLAQLAQVRTLWNTLPRHPESVVRVGQRWLPAAEVLNTPFAAETLVTDSFLTNRQSSMPTGAGRIKHFVHAPWVFVSTHATVCLCVGV